MQQVSAVIVSHNSQEVIERCLAGLQKQTHPLNEIVVVDSGSTETHYLEKLAGRDSISLIKAENIGFSKANNLGVKHLKSPPQVLLFLNPDTFLFPEAVEKACRRLDERPELGMLSGKLLAFDLGTKRANGKIDSSGVFRAIYGRWYDRGQGKEDLGQYDRPMDVPALCGALLFCRRRAVDEFAGRIFDPDFFLYKEDIELSLRLRKKGWLLEYYPEIVAYHCRGWQQKRRAVSLGTRIMAAKSEILLYKKHPSPYMLWALCKLILVRVFHI